MEHYKSRLGVIILVLSLATSVNHAQIVSQCQTTCYDADLELKPGSKFTWIATNFVLEATVASGSSASDRLHILSIDLEILQRLNELSYGDLIREESQYLRIIATVEPDGGKTTEELLYLIRLPALLISPGKIMINDSILDYYEYQANNHPLDFLLFQSVYAGGESQSITTQRTIIEDHYFEVTMMRTFLLNASSDEFYNIRVEMKTVEIAVETGILVKYEYNTTDSDGNLLDFNQIRLDKANPRNAEEVLDLGIFDNPTVLLGLGFTILGLVVIIWYFRRDRSIK